MGTLIKGTILTFLFCLSSPMISFAGEWAQDETGWRYLNDDGSYSVNEWQEIDYKNYYFDPEGYMLSNMITPDEYWVGADGCWVSESGIDQEAMAEKSMNGSLIVFDKFSYQMELWLNGEKIYHCLGIAGAFTGDKEMEGDYRTPEGEFYMLLLRFYFPSF